MSLAIDALHWIKPDVRRIGALPAVRDAVVDAVHARIALLLERHGCAAEPGRDLLGDALTMLDL